MPIRRTFLAAGVGALAASALPAIAQTSDRPNPMPDDLRQSLERDPTSPVLGNRDGNITLTEFFDYNCAHCRAVVGRIPELIGADSQLRIAYREWPVFGEGSEFAAAAALASLEQGKYWEFHHALLTMNGRAEEASVMRTARRVGLDETRLRQDIDADHIANHLALSGMLADHMGLMGTPTFICGDEAVFGEMTLTELRALVGRGRKTLGVA